MSQPAYINIATRKWEQVNALIPAQWRLSDQYIPSGMQLSPIDSVYQLNEFGEYFHDNLAGIPSQCGILSPKEVTITETWDVKGLLNEIAGKRLSAEEVALAFCKRTAIAQQLTRCVTEPLFTSALEEARRLDEHLQRAGQVIGPLHGLPVSIKDCFDIKGIDSSLGVAALAFKPATKNADLVDLLRSLGAVIIAKTNIPQTLALLDSVNHVFGRTLNPLNRRLTPGGSSGGEGVLVAMRGSMVGFGSDVGGSIRIPAMCNGIYGFKPSVGRLPLKGHSAFSTQGQSRVALTVVAGPIARSVQDIDFIMKEIVPRGELFGNDCIPAVWPPSSSTSRRKKLRVGILRSDGLVTPLPPIVNILNEVSQILAHSRDSEIDVVDIPTPPIMKECFFNAGRLMGIDGGGPMLDVITPTGEPLVPSLKGTVRRQPYSIEKLCSLYAQREEIETEMRKHLWSLPPSSSGASRHVDAIILPVAAHPVPAHDHYGCVSYTSAFNLLDYPAGTVPVRTMTETDLKLEMDAADKVLSKWDASNKKLWQGDRTIYLGSPLCIQVVTPKLHDQELCEAMDIIDSTLKRHYDLNKANKSML